jgi:hypothetical protein
MSTEFCCAPCRATLSLSDLIDQQGLSLLNVHAEATGAQESEEEVMLFLLFKFHTQLTSRYLILII